MRFIYTTDETVYLVKALAKLQRRTHECRQHQALDGAAVQFGYASYEHLIACLSHCADAALQGPWPQRLIPAVPPEAEGLTYRQDLKKFDMKLPVGREPGWQSFVARALVDGVPVSHDLKYLLFASSEENYGEDFDDFTVTD
jgi:hypothetical protein